MESKSEAALKRLFTRRINEVISLAETHCGHEGDIQKLVNAQMDFQGWFLAMMRSQQITWYYQGIEDAKKNPNIGDEI